MLGFLGILDLLQRVLVFLGYFSASESFPKPLKKEDETKYFVKFKEENDMHAKEMLINHNLRLVAHVSKKYSSSNITKEDLISIGIIGLIKGINSFDYNKGTKFATYGARCIDNEILMALRSETKTASNVFLEDYISFDEEGNNISLLDILATDEDDVNSKVNLKVESEFLYKIMDEVLEDREKEILYLRYGLKGKRSYTQREIADMYDISRSYVSRIEKKAIEKIAISFKKKY
ncbi:RNA polymerase sporulation sigma factor SigK [Anaerofustis stercorihominis]|uniref:RNA polymerase sigma factor n=1 Tax=Anaerofustis stercorihominis DSM 17244 TaxID=445971 RepID=B1CBI3_9FIRM|nr:RNA polymerase sporulation sigma factor SigK [Anaerofustis stercorihominis]EDS71630.1 RNA polymerase sigma-K factor [Anaerofustis stercorihominis DSM 17244]MCQ4796311.1 RNA polymerase sporulation sigma factor SigK [Anaerofustis stercorihominis]